MKIPKSIKSILLLVITTISCNTYPQKVSRILLTDNKVYKWKIYHTTENNFPAGKSNYFEVFYGKHQLILPKELTGGVREIAHFHAAGGFDSGETHYDSVVIIFEACSKDEKGFEQRKLTTVQVTSNNAQMITVRNLSTGQVAILNLDSF